MKTRKNLYNYFLLKCKDNAEIAKYLMRMITISNITGIVFLITHILTVFSNGHFDHFINPDLLQIKNFILFYFSLRILNSLCQGILIGLLMSALVVLMTLKYKKVPLICISLCIILFSFFMILDNTYESRFSDSKFKISTIDFNTYKVTYDLKFMANCYNDYKQNNICTLTIKNVQLFDDLKKDYSKKWEYYTDYVINGRTKIISNI